jgi:hypothetical protein
MVHEQATDKPCPDQERLSTMRRSGRLSGMIKLLVLQIACYAPYLVSVPLCRQLSDPLKF